jgi:sortase A
MTPRGRLARPAISPFAIALLGIALLIGVLVVAGTWNTGAPVLPTSAPTQAAAAPSGSAGSAPTSPGSPSGSASARPASTQPSAGSSAAATFALLTPSAPPPAETLKVGIVAVRIEIPRLGIDLPIVEGDGIDAPLHKAAHYPGTAWPGGGSNIYIYGHAQAGMFLALWEAATGDEVILTLIDGSQRTYRIDRVMPKVPWDAMELLNPTPDEQLTLQTSTSNTATAPRFVVIAKPQA